MDSTEGRGKGGSKARQKKRAGVKFYLTAERRPSGDFPCRGDKLSGPRVHRDKIIGEPG